MLSHLFGKYRFLVVSIALFLIFDLGVLILNFYTSGKLAQQAELINLAGQQRTLTQQMSKSTLYIKAQKLRLWVYQSGLEELREHYTQFGNTLDVLKNGGVIESAETGLPVKIEAVTSIEGRNILQQATVLWAEFDQVLAPLMVDVLITDEEIEPASAFIASNNLKLYRLMDKLTEHFKVTTERQATFLRRAQVVGITLATINFFVILFHFLRQLSGLDRRVKVKQHESDQILSTINEGVFLLNEELRIGGQHSKQLSKIFATKKASGRRLKSFLRDYFPKSTVATAMNFINLYFKDHVDPVLISDINPLKHVEASITKPSGESERRFLDFSFARLDQSNGEPRSVLVTVKDVTAEILLAAQEDQAQVKLDQKMALLTQILPVAPSDLDEFIRECMGGFDRINSLLKNTKITKDNFENTLTRVAREAHKLKGNASAVGMHSLAEEHHEFENSIQDIRHHSKLQDLSGRDLLPLAIKLDESYSTLETIAELRERLGSYQRPIEQQGRPGKSEVSKENSKWRTLEDYAQKLADEYDIPVSLNLRGFSKPIPEHLTERLYPLAVQLLRNSIAHGIESKSIRANLRKPNKGQMTISISHDLNNNFRFLFEDDGRGFDYERIRQDLIDKNIIEASQAKLLGHTALVQHAFKDSVSTRKKSDLLAGRGAGLPLVWQIVNELEGKLKIRSVKLEFTQFIVDFAYVNKGNPSPVMDKLLKVG
ncbi:MAG: type IV pili methyl-accepting chemotaxis transducer N-terminal domain-containing protein [Gammaproteobacteria bacterium]|nr:type IV pili methyl-accepting chemotaxis transducer N-terminal domain-containing protein [Gammaproteobacteria bacterium]